MRLYVSLTSALKDGTDGYTCLQMFIGWVQSQPALKSVRDGDRGRRRSLRATAAIAIPNVFNGWLWFAAAIANHAFMVTERYNLLAIDNFLGLIRGFFRSCSLSGLGTFYNAQHREREL